MPFCIAQSGPWIPCRPLQSDSLQQGDRLNLENRPLAALNQLAQQSPMRLNHGVNDHLGSSSLAPSLGEFCSQDDLVKTFAA